MTRPWGLWLFANGAAVLAGFATGWWEAGFQSTVLAGAISASLLSCDQDLEGR